MDITKIILTIRREFYCPGILDGYTLSKKLRSEYGIQSEYDSKTMVLLMSSVCNEASDFEALKKALIQIDHDMIKTFEDYENNRESSINRPLNTESTNYEVVNRAIAAKDTYEMCSRDAVHLPYILVARESCVGHIAAEYVIPYPPGIPILVPGERIHKETLQLFPLEKTHVKVLK